MNQVNTLRADFRKRHYGRADDQNRPISQQFLYDDY